VELHRPVPAERRRDSRGAGEEWLPVRRVVVLLIGFRGDAAPTWVVPCTNGWKVHARYSRLDDLASVVFVATDKKPWNSQASTA